MLRLVSDGFRLISKALDLGEEKSIAVVFDSGGDWRSSCSVLCCVELDAAEQITARSWVRLEAETYLAETL